MRRLAGLLVMAAVTGCASRLPRLGELNPYVLEVIGRYPTDGSHPYWWPRGPEARGWAGNTRDLSYGGTVLFRGDPKGRAFCCGLTFEVFLEAWRLWCHRTGRPWRIADLDRRGVERLKSQWFGSAEDRSCLRTALVANGLGVRIERWDDAQPGDFVQLWRKSGSGHSVVFLGWLRGPEHEITGLRYWSTQKRTSGIGQATERFGSVLREPFYLCRVGRPPRD